MKDSIRALSLVFAVLPAAVIVTLLGGAATEAPAGSVHLLPPVSATVTPSGSVTASITVPTTMRAGATVSGTITVDNRSGKTIHVLGCGSAYRVLLVGARRGSPCASETVRCRRFPGGRYEATTTGVSPELPVPAPVSVRVTP